MPCYNKGRCRVFLGYVFSRVWKFSQIHGKVIMLLTNETVSPVLPLEVLEALEETTTCWDGAGVGLLRVGAKLHDGG